MQAVIYIVDTLLWLLTLAFLLRLMFQLVRADFRDPMADAIVRITNWLVLPLRKVLPPIGKVDTATVVAVLLVACLRSFVLLALQGGHITDWPLFVRMTLIDLVRLVLNVYLFAMLLVCIDQLRVARRLRTRGPAPRTAMRTDLETSAKGYSTHWTDRFLSAVGVHHHRRSAGANTLNIGAVHA